MTRRLALAVALLAPAFALGAQRRPDVRYVLRVDAADTTAFGVAMTVRGTRDTFTLAWARHPEYDDRFWRFVEDMRAEPGTVVRVDSARWAVAAPGGATTLRWRVRVPFEERLRGAWRPFLSPTGALLGGAPGFPYVVGAERAPATVALELPAGWRAATALRRAPDGTLRAADVDELVESPILAGALREWRFAVREVPHRVAYWARPGAPAFDTLAFVDGLARLARQADALFGGMPYRDYAFLFMDDAYGGLEHPASVTIGAPADRLARDPHAALDDAAHEFIHTWNLMAIRPAEYRGVTWRAVDPVPTLWWFEGLTMFYTDALRRRAGLADTSASRAAHVASLAGAYVANPAYARFSPESLSRVEYNAAPLALGDYNASTHTAGELVGVALDLMIREATGDRRTMDDAMRRLYRARTPRGIGPADVERAIAATCGCDVRPFFDAHVRGAARVDLARWLRTVGLELQVTRDPARDDDGRAAPDRRVWAWSPTDGAPLRLGLQTPDGAWGRAGLHAGDVVTAIDGRAVRDWPGFRRAVSAIRVGDTVRVTLAAPEREVRFVMTGYDEVAARIVPMAGVSREVAARRERWLRGW